MRIKSISHLVHIVDWFPTLLKLAGADLTSLSTDGVDIWIPLTTGAKSEREILGFKVEFYTSNNILEIQKYNSEFQIILFSFQFIILTWTIKAEPSSLRFGKTIGN